MPATILAFLMVGALGQLTSGYPVGYRLTVRYETSAKSGDGSTSSSNGHSTYSVRRIATPAGEEVIYDLPANATAEERARDWSLPARVAHDRDGTIRLLNEPEVTTRRDAWLRSAKLDASACERWVFTWTAFKIECDPRSVLQLIEALDRPFGAVAAGSAVTHPLAVSAARAEPLDATHLTATLPIDPDAVQRMRAESDVASAEIMGQPTTFEAALKRRRADKIEGKVSIVFEVDATGAFVKRTTEVFQRVIEADGQTGEDRRVETVERQRFN